MEGMRVSAFKLSPSILTADFAQFGAQIAAAEEAGVDYIHVDVMDGRFVPNITIGPLIVQTLQRVTRLPLDVHLMIEEPERYLADFAKAGAGILTVHQEACRHLHRTLQQIRALGCRAGVAINPATPLEAVQEVVNDLDLLLVMTVNPGFGGQAFIESTADKVARARTLLTSRGARAELEVDGGIKSGTIGRVIAAGADVVVAGAAVFRPGASVQQAVAELRAAAGGVALVS
jgi:ribulose-phosphate 3-epimerase